MPMIEAETIKAIQELIQQRGVEQRTGEPLGDYVTRGLGVSAGKAQKFLDALHNGCTVHEGLCLAGIHDPRLLVRVARVAGKWLGRMTRRQAGVPTRRTGAGGDHIGAVEGQVSMAGEVPQRINAAGTKVEDLAGTGAHDSRGG